MYANMLIAWLRIARDIVAVPHAGRLQACGRHAVVDEQKVRQTWPINSSTPPQQHQLRVCVKWKTTTTKKPGKLRIKHAQKSYKRNASSTY